MVLNYQRWMPLECQCSFQQEVNSDTGEVKLLFAYNICDKHRPIAKKQKSKTTLVPQDFTNMKQEALNSIDKSLQDNRKKNLKVAKNEKHATEINNQLTKHENNVLYSVMEASQDPHSFSCGDVYNEVVRVAQEENKKAKGG